MTTYTILCDKPGCYWQGSTDNAAQAILWGTEHEDQNSDKHGQITDHRMSITETE